MPRDGALTTTSYAILGLLAVRPWSAYELARQMERSLGYIWPRAVSAIYEEPKTLVARGLAEVRLERGARRRSVYRITRAGRAALAAWLAQPSASPRFESEALVRVSLPEAGTKENVLATLRQLESDATQLESRVIAQSRSYVSSDGGPFPRRLHIIALDARFVRDYARFLRRWARWAKGEVERWPSLMPADVDFAKETIAALLRGVHD